MVLPETKKDRAGCHCGHDAKWHFAIAVREDLTPAIVCLICQQAISVAGATPSLCWVGEGL